MAEITINMPDGTQTTGVVSDLALEKTQEQMLEIMKKNFPKDVFKSMEKSMTDALDVAKETAKETKKSQSEADKDREAQLAALKQLADSGAEFTVDQDAIDRYNLAMAKGEKIFTTAYTAIVGFTGAVIAAAGIALGAFVKGFLDVGKELNTLAGVGVGFREMGDSAMTATQSMAKLSSKGINAAAMLENFSNVVASTGKGAFTQMTSAFMDATNAGVDLGMSLEDAVNRYGNELSVRQKLGALDNATAAGRAEANKQIRTNIYRQQQYSRALGVSTETLAEFSKSILMNTPVLTATLIRFSNDVRGKVTAGITDFASAMRGMGGEEGGQIAAAFTEAASMGAMGFSEEMTGYVRAVPSLAGPMNEYIHAIQNGTLSQEQAAEMGNQITMSLGNLSQAEKNRVFALARAGDSQAVSMAKAISQFEQTESRLKDINSNLSMEGVQTGTNTFNKILKEVTGMFDAFKYSFFAGVGSTDRFTDALKDAQGIIFDALGSAFKEMGGVGDMFSDLSGGAESFGEKVAEHLPKLITGVAEFIAGMIEFVPALVNGFKSFFSVLGTIGSIIKIALLPVTLAFKFLSGVVEGIMIPFKMIGALFGGLWSIVSGFFGLLGDGISAIADKFSGFGVVIDIIKYPFVQLGKLLGWFGGLLSDTGGSVVGTLGKLAGIVGVVLLAMKAFGSGIPSMLADMGKNLLSGLGNTLKSVGGVLSKGLSKITGGISDKVGGFVKSKLPGASKGGASPADDMGAKAMAKAGKASQSFTKTLANGMKDIGKGIADLFTNLAKGVSNSLTTLAKGLSNTVSTLASGISKSISVLAKGLGDAGKGIGKGIGSLLQGTLSGLGKGLAALGNPKALLGSAALVVISGALFISAKAFEVFGNLAWEDVAKGFVALGGLAVVASVLGLALPFIIPGAIAIGALGVALIPFAIAANIAAPAIETLFNGLASIKDVPISSMLALGPALIGMSVGMAALSAGGLISGLVDGLGKLVGADSPFDKIAKIGNAAPAIVEMAEVMSDMGTTVDTFNKSMKGLDSSSVKSHFVIMAEGINTLNEAMNELSMVDLLKLSVMKSVEPKPEEKETAKPTIVKTAMEQDPAGETGKLTAMKVPTKALDNVAVAAKQPLPKQSGQLFDANNAKYNIKMMQFMTEDMESFNKYQEELNAAKAKIQKDVEASGGGRDDVKMAMQKVKADLTTKYAPEMAAAGALTVFDKDTNEDITKKVIPSVEPDKTKEETTQREHIGRTIGAKEEKLKKSAPAQSNEPAEITPVTATPVQDMEPEKPTPAKMEVPQFLARPDENSKNTGSKAGEVDSPDQKNTLLAELLSETKTQNKLLKQQLGVSKNMADQI